MVKIAEKVHGSQYSYKTLRCSNQNAIIAFHSIENILHFLGDTGEFKLFEEFVYRKISRGAVLPRPLVQARLGRTFCEKTEGENTEYLAVVDYRNLGVAVLSHLLNCVPNQTVR